MTIPAEVKAINKRLVAAGVQPRDFYREAGISKATWSRWKDGNRAPLHDNWVRAIKAADKLAPRNGK